MTQVKERKGVVSEMEKILSKSETELMAFLGQIQEAVKAKHQQERMAKYDKVVKGLTGIMGEYLAEYPDLKGSKLVITTNGEVKVEFGSTSTRTRQGGPRNGKVYQGDKLVGEYHNKVDACKALGVGIENSAYAGKAMAEKGYTWKGAK
mgnify:CR=1 FL=1